MELYDHSQPVKLILRGPLVGSGDSDWEILFTQWGLLAQDQKIGATMRTLGYLGMLATIAWLASRVRHDAASKS